MIRNFNISNLNEVLIDLKKQFKENIEPTILTVSQFNKMFFTKKSVGQGTYGSVKCVQNCYRQTFVIKEPKQNDQKYGVYREVAIMKKFNHPNILKLIGFYKIQQTDKLMLLTQFCKYKSLKDYAPFLTHQKIQEKYRLALEIFNGVYAMHQENIIHRDLKPQNILIDSNRTAKICDFGFCTYDKELEKSRIVGTQLYNSPQTDDGVYTKKCDLYSYGLIVYFIFSNGKHLFRKQHGNQDFRMLRKTHFKNGLSGFNSLNAPADIKQILEKTITQKQQKRISSKDLKQLWVKIVDQNNLKNLKVGEIYKGLNYKKKEKQDNGSVYADQMTVLISSILKRDSLLKQKTENSNQIILLKNSLRNITSKMLEFKKEIESIDLPKTDKIIITFGSVLYLELLTENIFSSSIRFLQKLEQKNFIQFTGVVQKIVEQTIRIKELLGKNLTPTANYILSFKPLINPSNIFTDFMMKTIDEVKQIEKYLDQICRENDIQEYRKIHQIDSNLEFYTFIQNKFQLKIDLMKFKEEFKQLVNKFYCCQKNKRKDQEKNKVKTIIKEILSLKPI